MGVVYFSALPHSFQQDLILILLLFVELLQIYAMWSKKIYDKQMYEQFKGGYNTDIRISTKGIICACSVLILGDKQEMRGEKEDTKEQEREKEENEGEKGEGVHT